MKTRIVTIWIIALIFTAIIPIGAYADDSTVFLSEEELTAKRVKFESLEQSVGKTETQSYIPLYSILSTGVTIGANALLYPTAGNVYTSDVNARTEAAQGGSWLDCRTEYLPFAAGNGYAWGWIGEYITVSGSGSRACDITINGRYDGEIEALELNDIPIDTNAYASLYLQVYDVTGGAFL